MRPAWAGSKGCKSPARVLAPSAQPKARVPGVTPDLKEALGKRWALRTETPYEAVKAGNAPRQADAQTPTKDNLDGKRRGRHRKEPVLTRGGLSRSMRRHAKREESAEAIVGALRGG